MKTIWQWRFLITAAASRILRVMSTPLSDLKKGWKSQTRKIASVGDWSWLVKSPANAAGSPRFLSPVSLFAPGSASLSRRSSSARMKLHLKSFTCLFWSVGTSCLMSSMHLASSWVVIQIRGNPA